MKKTLLFFLTAFNCAFSCWADNCRLIGDELPSGSGVHERTITNIQYDIDTHQLTFEDNYEPDFSAYQRTYLVYFNVWDENYAFYENPTGSYDPVFWGTSCEDSTFIPKYNSNTESDLPTAYPWVFHHESNCKGGKISIDLGEKLSPVAVNVQSATGNNHVLVSIYPSYKISSTSESVYYSYYGDWQPFLLNSTHIKLVHGAEASISYASDGAGYIIEGKVCPIDKVVGDVNYEFQYRENGSAAWETLSTGSFSKEAFNDSLAKKSFIYAKSEAKLSDSQGCVRMMIAIDDMDTVYSVSDVNLNYDLRIADKIVTSENRKDVLGDGAVSYEPSTNTVILNNVGVEKCSNGFLSEESGDDLNIVLKGNNTINTTLGIYSNRNVNISGEGTLVIKYYMSGIDESADKINLTIEKGAHVVFEPIKEHFDSYGLNLMGGVLTIDDASLSVTAAYSVIGVGELVLKNGVELLSEGCSFSATEQSIVDATGNVVSGQVLFGVKETSDNENILNDSANKSFKVVRDGRVVILRDGKAYNVIGKEIIINE